MHGESALCSAVVTAPVSSFDHQPTLDRRRRAALRSFVVQRLGKGFAERTAFVLGIVIAAGFAGWMLMLFWVSPVDLTVTVLVRGVRWLSLVTGGIVALGLATDLSARENRTGISALLRQRGYDDREVRHAHLYATARLLVGTVGAPTAALAILAVALSHSLAALLARLLLTVGLGGYVLLLSGVLALCARWAVTIDRRRSRWVLLALLIGPEIARSSGVEIPGIPSLFGGLLEQVAAMGVGG